MWYCTGDLPCYISKNYGEHVSQGQPLDISYARLQVSIHTPFKKYFGGCRRTLTFESKQEWTSKLKSMTRVHCVKSVRIRRFPGPYFSAFGLNAEIIQSEWGKVWSRKTPNTYTFYAVALTEAATRTCFIVVLKMLQKSLEDKCVGVML